MLQVILRFGARQSVCRFFCFSIEDLPIALRINRLTQSSKFRKP
jgi:hypothetical protein